MTAMVFFLLMIINLFCNKELKKLWKKTFKTIHQFLYVVGHPVCDLNMISGTPCMLFKYDQ